MIEFQLDSIHKLSAKWIVSINIKAISDNNYRNLSEKESFNNTIYPITTNG